ncbi:hypothetical protein WA1_47620 [Scytonema hofmannii PCC 7110]|uniref:Uncharacterized protein n=1 Tax=Scytonema hofmannii PCC 7110 TaxID=128403 RepID=A0A139WXW9_9CYAN|nr:CHAT domain-containing protein [Scytonema hofmannii]KYC37291.1 hypothetical protein WA1_47620 [Scytonema hofmannii PCC 7110]
MNNSLSVKTILILAANPTNTSRLRLDEEVREIDEGLRRSNQREQFKLEQKWAVRSRDFYRAILDYQPQIVHFSGHGAGQEGLVLEDEMGQPAFVKADALVGMFEIFATNGVECVVLNACYSEMQAEAISQHINYVIGMNQAIGDRSAINFTVAFYDTLAAGKDVESAFKLGLSQLISLNEYSTPVFKKKTHIIQTLSNFIPPNPYQGLFAFGEKDAEFFYGREKFVENLVQTTHKEPLITVVGSSGSGKSSVVFAGLIPRLRIEGTWLIESFRPGKQPFDELASALVRQLEPELGKIERVVKAVKLAERLKNGEISLQQIVSGILESSNKRLLVIADQFEELYTLCPDKKQQERFVDILLEAIYQKSLTLVLTLRADFYDDVLSYPPFCHALQEFTPQLLSSMSRDELKATIEMPAQKLKVQLEEHLTERILDDVGQEPGSLPLLEFALAELWKKQQALCIDS